METTALINKKIVNSNWCLKQAQKTEKKLNKKGSRKNLKNYLGKVLLPADQVVGDEERMTGFEATISQTELLAKLQKANLIGMSGNQFLVHQKIRNFLNASTGNRTLLINAVECDPGLVHDRWLVGNRSLEINQTAACLSRIVLRF